MGYHGLTKASYRSHYIMVGRKSRSNACTDLMVTIIHGTSSLPMDLGQIPLDCTYDSWVGFSKIACSIDFTKSGEKQLITISQLLNRVGASLNILDLETLTWRNIYCTIKYKGIFFRTFPKLCEAIHNLLL